MFENRRNLGKLATWVAAVGTAFTVGHEGTKGTNNPPESKIENLSSSDSPDDKNIVFKPEGNSGIRSLGSLPRKVQETDPVYETVEDGESKVIGSQRVTGLGGGYEVLDLTRPVLETATDENLRDLQNYLSKNLPDYQIERRNENEYILKMKRDAFEKTGSFQVVVRAEDDGSYTVNPPSPLGHLISAKDIDALGEVILQQMNFKSMEEKNANGEITDEEFTAFLESKVGIK